MIILIRGLISVIRNDVLGCILSYIGNIVTQKVYEYTPYQID